MTSIAEDPARGSGRTTRMLERAISAARAGQKIVVVAHCTRFARELCGWASEMIGPDDLVIRGQRLLKFSERCGDGSLKFCSIEQVRSPSYVPDPDELYIEDHYVGTWWIQQQDERRRRKAEEARWKSRPLQPPWECWNVTINVHPASTDNVEL